MRKRDSLLWSPSSLPQLSLATVITWDWGGKRRCPLYATVYGLDWLIWWSMIRFRFRFRFILFKLDYLNHDNIRLDKYYLQFYNYRANCSCHLRCLGGCPRPHAGSRDEGTNLAAGSLSIELVHRRWFVFNCNKQVEIHCIIVITISVFVAFNCSLFHISLSITVI